MSAFFRKPLEFRADDTEYGVAFFKLFSFDVLRSRISRAAIPACTNAASPTSSRGSQAEVEIVDALEQFPSVLPAKRESAFPVCYGISGLIIRNFINEAKTYSA